jgi:O-antigen/teichoic acid export membrane protein
MTAFSVLLPILSAELNRDGGLDEHSEMRVELHVLNVYVGWYIATAVAVCLLFFVEPVLSLFGRGFLAGDLALALVLCSIPIVSYKYGIARLVQAKSMMWYAFASNLMWAAFLMFGTLSLAQYGAVGLGAAYLLAYAMNAIIMVPFYFKKLHLTRFIRMDATLGVLLTSALVPGMLANMFSFPTLLQIVMAVISLVPLIVAGERMLTWLGRRPRLRTWTGGEA